MTVIHVQHNDSIHVHEKTAPFRLHFSQVTCIIPVEGNKQKNADTYEEPIGRIDALHYKKIDVRKLNKTTIKKLTFHDLVSDAAARSE